MVLPAAKVAVAGVVVAAICLLVTVPETHAHGSSSKTCRYRLREGQSRTISSSLRASGRLFDLLRRNKCTRHQFVCVDGYLVISFQKTVLCRNGAIVLSYDGTTKKVCGQNSGDIVTEGNRVLVSTVTRGGPGGRDDLESAEDRSGGHGHHSGGGHGRPGGHGSGGHGSGGHGSGGHGSGGHGSGGHSSSEEDDDYEYTVECKVDTTTTVTTTPPPTTSTDTPSTTIPTTTTVPTTTTEPIFIFTT